MARSRHLQDCRQETFYSNLWQNEASRYPAGPSAEEARARVEDLRIRQCHDRMTSLSLAAVMESE